MSKQAPRSKSEKESTLQADLEATWQDEAPLTAKRTDFADEVDGELGTRHKHKSDEESGSGASA